MVHFLFVGLFLFWVHNIYYYYLFWVKIFIFIHFGQKYLLLLLLFILCKNIYLYYLF